jgi:integrase
MKAAIESVAEVVKYKTVSITIYPITRSTGQYWQFKRQDGSQVTRVTLQKARTEAKNYAQATYKGTLDLDTLTPEQIRAMKRMIEADPTCRLVDEFLVWHGKKAPKKPTQDAYKEFMLLKDGNSGRSTQNGRTLRKHIKPFVDLHGKTSIAAITVGDVEAYLTSNPKNGNRTRRNIRASVVTFFRWCRLREYLPDEKTVAEKAEIPVVSDTIPETYSPAELAVLLANVRPEYRAWLAIAAWAGVRNDEICPIAGSRKIPLDWADVNFERKIITVRPETAKMKRRRVIPMCAALRSVLLPLRRESGPVHAAPPPTKDDGKGKQAETARLGKLVGGWRSNALRHSFISYRCAQVGLGVTAMEAGNSEAEAKRSYLDAKSPEEATAWFAPPKRVKSR